MLLVLDKETKEVIFNSGTNSAFPMGVPYNPQPNELVFRFDDSSELAMKALKTGNFKVVLNEEDELVDIEVLEGIEFEEITDKITTEQRVEFLEAENAELWYQTMLADSKIENTEIDLAMLWYELMMGGM